MAAAWVRHRWPSRREAYDVLKIVLPPHIAVLILVSLVLINQVSNAVGDYAFLVLTYLHLFFYPEGTIGDHVEKVLIHLFMCAFGQAVTFLFVCITIWIDQSDTSSSIEYRTNGAKALGACVLGGWCFLGGIVQSRYPRFKMAMRILLFSSTWTICIGASRIHAAIFTGQFYPAALAAGASLLSHLLIFPRSASDDFARLLIRVYNVEKTLLEQVMSEFFTKGEDAATTARRPSPKLVDLQQQMLETVSILGERFKSARLEINYGRLPVVEAKSLVSSIDRSKGWYTCGMGLGTRESLESALGKVIPPQERQSSAEKAASATHNLGSDNIELEAAEPAVAKLMGVLLESVQMLAACIELTMSGGSPRTISTDERWQVLYRITGHQDVKKPSLTLLRQRQKMAMAIESFKIDLAYILQRLAATTSTDKIEVALQEETEESSTSSTTDPPRSNHGMFRSDIYDIAFFMVSLMEIAEEMESSLTTCQSIIAQWHAHPRKRLWLPSVSLSWWLRTKFERESQPGLVFHEENDQGDLFSSDRSVEVAKGEVAADAKSAWHWTRNARIIHYRIVASMLLRSIKRSKDLRYGIKLAAGAVLLSLPAWMTQARSWFVQERGVWLVVTYIWVLETSTGATIRVSLYRTIGTIAGALWAIIAWYICDQGNRFGIGFFIILAQVPACYFILFSKHAQSLGLVFAFTQSVILLFPLMPTGAGFTSRDVVHLGLVRWYQIMLGIVAAFLVNVFVWPLHARVYLLSAVSCITRQCSTIYLSLARQMLNHGVIIGPETTKKFGKLEHRVQRELIASRDYLEIMSVELSLVPKPVNTLSLVLKTLQRIANLLNLLRQCRDVALRIIQKEACFNVLNLRRELVSSILLTFWIVGQSLITKEKLPQFLPSCRDALGELTEAMREEISSKPLHVDTPRGEERMSSSPPAEQEQLQHHNHQHHRSLPSLLLSRRRSNYAQASTSSPRQGEKVIDYSYFFIFAEHTLLSEIIFEIDKLLFLTKLLVGESSFIGSHYLPQGGGGGSGTEGAPTPKMGFNPSMLDPHDMNAFRNSVSEHGVDGRRLASKLDAHIRATRSEG